LWNRFHQWRYNWAYLNKCIFLKLLIRESSAVSLLESKWGFEIVM
jgi:hypothetical protein